MEDTELKTVAINQGRIQYWEMGEGPPLLFLHGFAVSGFLWRNVVADLAHEFRCIVPTWPMGSHHLPMDPETDLSPVGLVKIVKEFVDKIGLKSFTLIGNDLGGAISQMFTAAYPDKVDRLVLTPCDAFGNFPPPTFRYLVKLPRFRPIAYALSQLMRVKSLRKLPVTYGWLSKGALSMETIDRYVTPMIQNAGIRRDAAKVITQVASRYTEDIIPQLRLFSKPVLLAWAKEDRFFPYKHALDLSKIFPQAQVFPIEDSLTLVAEDQPIHLAQAIRQFVA